MTTLNADLLLNDYARYLKLLEHFGAKLSERYSVDDLKALFFGDETKIFWFGASPGDLFHVFKRKHFFVLRDLTVSLMGSEDHDTISWDLRHDKTDEQFIEDVFLIFESRLGNGKLGMKRHWQVEQIKSEAENSDLNE